jgi:hypothetical protein
MFLLFPWFAWIATATSAVLLVFVWKVGEVDRRSLLPLLGAFLVAAYGQWVARSDLVNKVGLVLQTLLAVYLIVRLKLGR